MARSTSLGVLGFSDLHAWVLRHRPGSLGNHGSRGAARAGFGLLSLQGPSQTVLTVARIPGLLHRFWEGEAGRFGPQRSQKQEKTLSNAGTKALPILRDLDPLHQEGSQRKCPAPGSRVLESWEYSAPLTLCRGCLQCLGVGVSSSRALSHEYRTDGRTHYLTYVHLLHQLA